MTDSRLSLLLVTGGSVLTAVAGFIGYQVRPDIVGFFFGTLIGGVGLIVLGLVLIGINHILRGPHDEQRDRSSA